MATSKKLKSLLLAGALCIGMPAHAGWFDGMRNYLGSVSHRTWGLASLAAGAAGMALTCYAGYVYCQDIKQKRKVLQNRLDLGLRIAATVHNADHVRLFWTAGADIGDQGAAVLRTAIEAGDKNLLRTLLEDAGVDVNEADVAGRTALHHAVTVRPPSEEIIRILLDAGAEINCVSPCLGTPLKLAIAFRCDSAVAELLLQAGANVNLIDSDEHTALEIAIIDNRPDIVSLLIQHGADINALNNDGQTALEIAERHGHTAIAELIKREQALRDTVPALLGVESLVHREATEENQFPRLQRLPELRANILSFVAGVDPETENNKRQHGS